MHVSHQSLWAGHLPASLTYPVPKVPDKQIETHRTNTLEQAQDAKVSVFRASKFLELLIRQTVLQKNASKRTRNIASQPANWLYINQTETKKVIQTIIVIIVIVGEPPCLTLHVGHCCLLMMLRWLCPFCDARLANFFP